MYRYEIYKLSIFVLIISFRIQNKKGKVENYLNFINQIEDKLIALQSHRIGLSSVEFKNKIYN
jgi:hypothetical protein